MEKLTRNRVQRGNLDSVREYKLNMVRRKIKQKHLLYENKYTSNQKNKNL
jgi:hypothetical protein